MELKNISGIKKQMRDDVSILSQVIAACEQAATRSGLEGYEDNGKVFVEAAASFKARYGVTIEPTLAGMESMVDSLKSGLNKLDVYQHVAEIIHPTK